MNDPNYHHNSIIEEAIFKFKHSMFKQNIQIRFVDYISQYFFQI